MCQAESASLTPGLTSLMRLVRLALPALTRARRPAPDRKEAETQRASVNKGARAGARVFDLGGPRAAARTDAGACCRRFDGGRFDQVLGARLRVFGFVAHEPNGPRLARELEAHAAPARQRLVLVDVDQNEAGRR